MTDKYQNKYRIPSVRLQSWVIAAMQRISSPFVPQNGNIILGK